MASKGSDIKVYPEIGGAYKHYKGGKYTVLTMAEHSEHEEVEKIFKELNSMKLKPQAKELLDKLKNCFEDKLVIYKSIHYGSTHARPLHMWFEKVREDLPMNPSPARFEEI